MCKSPDHTRTTDDGWHSQATFEKVALTSTQRIVATKAAAIVGGEEDISIICNAKLIQGIKDRAKRAVGIIYHSRIIYQPAIGIHADRNFFFRGVVLVFPLLRARKFLVFVASRLKRVVPDMHRVV